MTPKEAIELELKFCAVVVNSGVFSKAQREAMLDTAEIVVKYYTRRLQ